MNSTRAVLEGLRQLQELDRQIMKLRGSVDLAPDTKKAREELVRVYTQEQENLRGVDELRLIRNQTQSGLDLCRQRIVKAESALKEIKSSGAFQATLKEIDQLKTLEQNLELKERSVEKEAETLRSQMADLQTKRETLEREVKAQFEVTKAKDHEIEASVREIEAQKLHFQGQIPVKFLSLYQRIAASRGGIAAAEIKGSSCGACHIVLPAQFVNELRRSKSIEQCPSCKRILLVAIVDQRGG